MRLALPALLLAAAVLRAGPSEEYVREYEGALLDSTAVIEATVVAEPSGDGDKLTVRLRSAKVLAGEGPVADTEFDAALSVPPLESCVGGPPTDEDRAAHRKQYLGLFARASRWVFALEVQNRHQGTPWRVRRAYDTEGQGRADVERLLARRADLAAIVALIVDLPQLRPYWHEDTDGRKPLLLLASDSVRRSLSLEKFGEPVLVLTKEQIEERKAEAWLEISPVVIEGDVAKAAVRYPVEGVSGTVGFRRENGAWVVKDASLSEK